MRAYLDSCIVIYIVEAAEPWSARIAATLRDAAPVIFAVSDLVRMECRVQPLRRADGFTLAEFERFFNEHRPLRVTEAVFETATAIRAEHGLKTPDALHLACAIEAGCDEFWTNDHRLDRVAASMRTRVFE